MRFFMVPMRAVMTLNTAAAYRFCGRRASASAAGACERGARYPIKEGGFSDFEGFPPMKSSALFPSRFVARSRRRITDDRSN
jgi:hypothetical protein